MVICLGRLQTLVRQRNVSFSIRLNGWYNAGSKFVYVSFVPPFSNQSFIYVECSLTDSHQLRHERRIVQERFTLARVVDFAFVHDVHSVAQ